MAQDPQRNRHKRSAVTGEVQPTARIDAVKIDHALIPLIIRQSHAHRSVDQRRQENKIGPCFNGGTSESGLSTISSQTLGPEACGPNRIADFGRFRGQRMRGSGRFRCRGTGRFPNHSRSCRMHAESPNPEFPPPMLASL